MFNTDQTCQLVAGSFGEIVKHHRLKRNWSLSELSFRTRISRQGLYNIEQHAVPRLHERTLFTLAKAFGLEPEELMAEYETAKAGEIGGSIIVDGKPLPDDVVRAAVGVAKRMGKPLPDFIRWMLDLHVDQQDVVQTGPTPKGKRK